MNYQDIINENKLPTLDDFKLNQQKIFGFSIPFIEGFIENPDIRLTMDLNDFMNFVKENNIDKVIGKIITYDESEIYITRDLFEEKTDISADISNFTKVIVSDYRLSLSEENQLDYVLDELDSTLYNNEEYTEKYTEDEQHILHLYVEEDENEYEDDNEDEYKLTSTAKNLLEDIIKYNNSIPEEIFKIPEKIQLNCILDGITYSVIVSNTIKFNPTQALLEILSKYQSKYDSKIKDKIEKDKQLEYEAEQKRLDQKIKHDTFIDRILSDHNYTCLTNADQRLNYLKQLFMNQLDDNEYSELANEVYSKVNSGILGISNYQIKEVMNEIKAIALQKGVKLGR